MVLLVVGTQAATRQTYGRLRALVEPAVPEPAYEAAECLTPAALLQLVARVREVVDNDRWAFAPLFHPYISSCAVWTSGCVG
jgi:hypothetical protein